MCEIFGEMCVPKGTKAKSEGKQCSRIKDKLTCIKAKKTPSDEAGKGQNGTYRNNSLVI